MPKTRSADALFELRVAYADGYGHPNTLRRAIHDGALTAHKIGNRFKVSLADLEAWSRLPTTAPTTIPEPVTVDEDSILAAAKRVAGAFPARTPAQKADVAFILSAGRSGGDA